MRKQPIKIMTSLITFSLLSVSSTWLRAEQQKDFSLDISPDGQKMVYYSYRGNALPDLFIANIDGTEEQQITNTPTVWEIVPRWSPDGDSIIYSAGPSMADLEIHQINVHTRVVKQITEGKGKGHAASWAPDGNSFFYTRMYEDGHSNIYQKWLSTDKEINHTNEIDSKNVMPIVSPSGEYVAFVSDRGVGDDLDIFVADVGFSNITQITEDDIRQDFITWSPDGASVLYSGPLQEGAKHDLFAVSVNTRIISQITNDPVNHNYFSTFSPDGKYLYVDAGDWDRNFFFYRAKWTGEQVVPEQVTGKNWVDTIAVMENEFLAPMIGEWVGVSSFGRSKGRYEEQVSYQWGPNKKSIVVDMEMFWDGESFGKAKGLLGLDRAEKKVYFNLTMEDGTIVMQEQTNPGVSDNWVMDVVTHGNSRFYPKTMRVKFERVDFNYWKTEVYTERDGKETLVDVHEFTQRK